MVKYLKKKRMFELLKQLVELADHVKSSDCTYKFYRGTEWLRLDDGDHIFELCASNGGLYLAFNLLEYDWETYFERIVERHVYNGCGKMEVSIFA